MHPQENITWLIIISVEIAVLISCVSYIWIYYKAHRHHKKELARMAKVADEETMQKHVWNPAAYLHEQAEADLAEKIREGLKKNQE